MKAVRNLRNTACLLLTLSALMLTSCVKEDLNPCLRELRLQIVYDYNMEYANAFHNKVDCIRLYVYKEDGTLLKTFKESSEALKDESYRMRMELPNGTYTMVCYGGLDCEASTFSLTGEPLDKPSMESLKVSLSPLKSESDNLLHDLYFGSRTVTVDIKGKEGTQDEKLFLTKDTNSIRIILQQIDGEAVNPDDFIMIIEDANAVIDYQNKPSAFHTYLPFATGQASTGLLESGSEAVTAWAEFSTSRLMTDSGAQLTIKGKKEGNTVLSIPLASYLLLSKQQADKQMTDQEYLDRQSSWSIVFFLDSYNRWIKTSIIVNGWTVRQNQSEA